MGALKSPAPAQRSTASPSMSLSQSLSRGATPTSMLSNTVPTTSTTTKSCTSDLSTFSKERRLPVRGARPAGPDLDLRPFSATCTPTRIPTLDWVNWVTRCCRPTTLQVFLVWVRRVLQQLTRLFHQQDFRATSCSQENLPCLDNCQTSHLQNNDWTASGFHIVLT